MELQSNLFRGDQKLRAAANDNAGHILPGAQGDHVGKIQQALQLLDNAAIDSAEATAKRYGPSTALAVRGFKFTRKIVNASYQTVADDIVGIMTMKVLDDGLVSLQRGGTTPAPTTAPTNTHQQSIDAAETRSKASVRNALRILNTLSADIKAASNAQGTDKIVAISRLVTNHARDIAVLDRRLLTGLDPFSTDFQSALARAIELLTQHAALSGGIRDDGSIGRCLPAASGSTDVPFAATTASDPEPKVSVCTPFFAASAALQRDVVTHERFHVLGLEDLSGITTTDRAFRNANTMAQVVALLNDRTRQANSDGNEPAIPPLPMP